MALVPEEPERRGRTRAIPDRHGAGGAPHVVHPPVHLRGAVDDVQPLVQHREMQRIDDPPVGVLRLEVEVEEQRPVGRVIGKPVSQVWSSAMPHRVTVLMLSLSRRYSRRCSGTGIPAGRPLLGEGGRARGVRVAAHVHLGDLVVEAESGEGLQGRPDGCDGRRRHVDVHLVAHAVDGDSSGEHPWTTLSSACLLAASVVLKSLMQSFAPGPATSRATWNARSMKSLPVRSYQGLRRRPSLWAASMTSFTTSQDVTTSSQR